MKRRTFIRSAGAAGAGLAGVGTAGTAAAEHRDYRYHGTAPAPGVEEIVTWGEWAFCANNGAITTVDLSDPTTPLTADRTQGPTDQPSTHDVKLSEYETAAGEERLIAILTHTRVNNGFSVFDVTDPASIEYITSVPTASTVHNAFFKDGYAYLCITDSTQKSRLVIYDVHDPENPVTLEGEDPSYETHSDVPPDERGRGGAWMMEHAQPRIASSSGSVLHDLYVTDVDDGEIAWLAFWDGGVVAADVTEKRNPVAVAHFGAVEHGFDSTSTVEYVNGGGESNAHYVQPTPDNDYTFVGAETFGGSGHDEVGATGGYGGIRAFDTRRVAPLNSGGVAVYPDADGVADLPASRKRPLEAEDVIQTASNRRHPSNFVDYVAYIEPPEQPDDALLTSHNFDVTETKLFTSWYQGGVRAFDLSPLYVSGACERHPEHAGDVEAPREIASFAPDGMAFWTAVNLESAQDGETYFTVGSDIGKGACVLELSEGPFTPLL